MITQISAVNMKGISFQQDIAPLTLFLGNNGSGKSARTQALILALKGYIPGAGKTNGEILESYGIGDKLVVGVKIGGMLFERGFVRKDAKVSQGFKLTVNGVAKSVKEADFARSLGTAGEPVAIDITAFMALSDAKKIDTIFSLYPPEADISKLISAIEVSKNKINDLAAKSKAKEAAATQLVTARAAMELPMGTLADTVEAIKNTEEKLAQARQDLKAAEVKEAEEAGRKKGQAEAQKPETIQDRKELLKKQAEQIKAGAIAPATEPSGSDIVGGGVLPLSAKAQAPATIINPAEAIQNILNAINNSGCQVCTARLVAFRELKKCQEANNGR